MLHAVGIVAEYNPFHNGHRYQLLRAKEITGADVTIAIMSSNWLQRGEPALLDKWDRTKLALQNGVDLVIELPVQFAVQPAHRFAMGGVQLAAAINCDWLAYGAEHPEIDMMNLVMEQPRQSDFFRRFDQTYAAQYDRFLQAATGIRLTDSNDILAFAYAQANQQLGSPLHLVPVKREQSRHRDPTIERSTSVASGTAIRRAAFKQRWDTVGRVVPEATLNALQQKSGITWADFWPQLQSGLGITNVNRLRDFYMMTEGIEFRLQREARRSTNFDQFMQRVKTKRYTYTRLQRQAVYALLQLTPDEMIGSATLLRVLGFNDTGRAYLHQEKKRTGLPLITQLSPALVDGEYQAEYRAGLMRQMVTGVEQDLHRHPIYAASL
ncbi:nucleotidyltransferase [Levilactobacillus bambusae]|uniref:tRNA(Met) cytidine acetate ligase n=1 Tax=Levilactobacillus bambusae TaxID=2024736 RepID=A0A2V1N158_9LACO|nr:nucleotidyltransferase [Levilactobacillus bambusae]PWG01021.1 nucleotidyltransferase [Levilactobacillus bambusae]